MTTHQLHSSVPTSVLDAESITREGIKYMKIGDHVQARIRFKRALHIIRQALPSHESTCCPSSKVSSSSQVTVVDATSLSHAMQTSVPQVSSVGNIFQLDFELSDCVFSLEAIAQEADLSSDCFAWNNSASILDSSKLVADVSASILLNLAITYHCDALMQSNTNAKDKPVYVQSNALYLLSLQALLSNMSNQNSRLLQIHAVMKTRRAIVLSILNNLGSLLQGQCNDDNSNIKNWCFHWARVISSIGVVPSTPLSPWECMVQPLQMIPSQQPSDVMMMRMNGCLMQFVQSLYLHLSSQYDLCASAA
jgi:hypothetical protein